MLNFLFKSRSRDSSEDIISGTTLIPLSFILGNLGLRAQENQLIYFKQGYVDEHQILDLKVELKHDSKSVKNIFFTLKDSGTSQEISFSFKDINQAFNQSFSRWLQLMSSSQIAQDEFLHQCWRKLDSIVFGEDLLNCIPSIEALKWRWGELNHKEPAKREADLKIILRRLASSQSMTPEEVVELVHFCRPSAEIANGIMSILNYGSDKTSIATKAAWLNSFADLLSQSVLYKAICSTYGFINTGFGPLFEEKAATKITREYWLIKFRAENNRYTRSDKSKPVKVPELSKIFEIFTPSAQKAAASVCIQEGFVHGKLKEILSSIQDNHQILALFESVRDVPARIAYTATEQNLALTMIQVFKDLDQNDYALHLIKKNRKMELVKFGLPRMEGLSYEVLSEFFKDTDPILTQVLSNLESFNLSKDQQRELVLTLHASNRLNLIIAALDSIPEKILLSFEREFFLSSYKNDLGICSSEIYLRYKELSRPDLLEERRAFTSYIKSSLKALTMPGSVNLQSIKDSPYCDALVTAVYPFNGQSAAVVNWDTRYRNIGLNFPEHSQHLHIFSHSSPYRLNTSEGVDMVLKPNRYANQSAINEITQPIEEAHKMAFSLSFDEEHVLEVLYQKARSFNLKFQNDETKEEIILQAYSNFLTARMPRKALVELLALYEFITEPNLENYFLETTDRASKAKNKEYAHLLELREYFADKIRDTQDSLLEVWSSYGLDIDVIKEIYSDILRKREAARRHQVKSRLQADQLGMSPAFYQQINSIEKTTEDPQAAKTVVIKMRQGMQKRISAFMQEYAGITVNYEAIDLESFNLVDFESANPIKEPKLDNQGYLDLFKREFRELFNNEVELIDSEIAKYTADSTKKLKSIQIQAAFMKNQASWSARRTAGVCVFNCQKQWNMPNYLQLVFFDPIKIRCEGLILLHYYNDSNGKVLTASFNPTSTLLYKVDEKAFFDASFKILVEFAHINDFDFICCATQKGIRTNRTGGEFERALSSQISRYKKSIKLDSPADFSSSPHYVQQVLDVLWHKE
jgi:hypothetical protein